MERENHMRKYIVHWLPPPITQDSDAKFMKLKKELLPGISNEVTLAEIATKMHWSSFPTMSTLNLYWEQAIHGRLVLDARIRNHSVESLVVVLHTHRLFQKRSISLFSLREKVFYPLPPVPHNSRIPWCCEGVSLGGKIYILGGHFGNPRKDVYMLDMTRKSEWVLCASMKEGRGAFGSAVLNGKIYVFGGYGTTSTSPYLCCGSEMYDPTVNAWSEIRSILDLRAKPLVITLGDELLVYDGNPSSHGQAYNSITGEWNGIPEELLKYLQTGLSVRKFFMDQGRLHSLSFSKVDVYDIEKMSWTQLHDCSFAGIQLTEGLFFQLERVTSIDNELLANLVGRNGPVLIQSRGFGGKEKEIVWEILPLCFPDGSHMLSIMCNIEL